MPGVWPFLAKGAFRKIFPKWNKGFAYNIAPGEF